MRKPRLIWSAAAQIESPVRWKPNIDDGHLTEAVLKDSQGTVLGSRVFHDAFDLVEQLCPGVAQGKHPDKPPLDLRQLPGETEDE